MSERKRLIDLLMDKPFGRATEEEETQHIEDVADYLIANGVTIQAHGRWNPIPYYKVDGKGCVFKYCDFDICSECATKRPMVPPDNYCPNCGARMDGDSQ